jgi:hypothetical protein
LRVLLERKDDVEDSKKITDSNITNHDIFTYRLLEVRKVPTFQFSTEYRTLVFRKYLSIYLKIIKENV